MFTTYRVGYVCKGQNGKSHAWFIRVYETAYGFWAAFGHRGQVFGETDFYPTTQECVNGAKALIKQY